MNILFTIAGRAGSKGIKNKNIRDFNGRPLPYYSLSAIDLYLKKIGALPVDGEIRKGSDRYDVALSTDSEELIDLIKKNPFMKVEIIRRTEELSGDTVAKKDVIWDMLTRMEERKGCLYDMVVDLDLTSPLRTVEDVSNLIETSAKTGADITYSVTPCRRNPYFNQVIRSDKGFCKAIDTEFTARQQAPEVYDMNASLYAYRPGHLKAGGGFNEGYFEAIIMYDTAVLDLDHENDFELMELIADYLYKKKPEFGEIYRNIPEKR